MNVIGLKYRLSLDVFNKVVFGGQGVSVCSSAIERLDETRDFIDFLLASKKKIYGINTGFADLRKCSIDPELAQLVSINLIESHDAGIGAYFSYQITLGAMLLRASSLSKGYSGIQYASLDTLIKMINAQIVPLIPKTGSLGASGDLCMLSRLARAMQGKNVPVWYQGKIMTASCALKEANIPLFQPLAKEGLAMINGTSFMTSMIGIAFLDEIHLLENILAMQGVFYNAVGAIEAPFNASLHEIRPHRGQRLVAKILSDHFLYSDFINFEEVQNDYCVRCIPQIFGPRIESVLEQFEKIEIELNAVTDNPLFFRGAEISQDVNQKDQISWGGQKWAIISGGNFHGENMTTIADVIVAANAKLALSLERQISYMLNPVRNKTLPCYLIPSQKDLGISSGYMITQYTANALAQKICHLAHPTSIFNITSGNESEDIVSYGASAAEKLLEQIEYMKELTVVYLTVVIQAYGIQRQRLLATGKTIAPELLAEKIFQKYQAQSEYVYPIGQEESFEKRYKESKEFLSSLSMRKIMDFPLWNYLQGSSSWVK